jgi:hypothetical protein
VRRRLRTATGAVAAALAVAAIVVVTGDDDRPADERRVRAPARDTAQEFLDSIGVGMHLHYVDTSYGRQREVLDRLRELGVRHVREGVPVGSPPLSRGLRAVAAMGIRGTLTTTLEIAPGPSVAGAIRDMGDRLEAVEGPNELDHSTIPDWRDRLPGFMAELRSAARGRTVVGPSFVDPGLLRGVDGRVYDLANIHPYPGGQPPEEPLAEHLARAEEAAPGREFVITETGYHNALNATAGQPPVSEDAAAAYLPRLLLWAYDAGVRRTFVYELADEKPDPGRRDPEQHFGLLRQDLTPKPAFHAVRNLIAAIRRSPGRARGDPPLPEVAAADPVERVELTRSDGSRVVALWRRTVPVWDVRGRAPLEPPPRVVELSWPAAVRDVSVTRPSRSPRPERELRSTDVLRLELRGEVALVSYR